MILRRSRCRDRGMIQMQKDRNLGPMGNMEKEQRTILIIIAVLGVISLIAFIFDSYFFGADSPFRNDITDNSVINFIYHEIPAVFRTCQILFVSLLLFMLLRKIQKGINIVNGKKILF